MFDRSAQLATRYVRTHEAARILGISPRTLIRWLHDDGATYQALLDAARKQRALWLLQRTSELGRTTCPISVPCHRAMLTPLSRRCRTRG